MRKLIIAALVAAIAVLGLASVASASVAVDDDGVGSIGKGDVQTALGLNDAGIQSLFQSDVGVHFSLKVVTAYDNYWACSDGSVHPYTHTVMSNRPVVANAHTNNAGKLTSGWDLPGVFGTNHGGSWDDLSEPFGMCPTHGSYVTDVRVDDPLHSTVTRTPYVNGWAELPNTPVDATA